MTEPELRAWMRSLPDILHRDSKWDNNRLALRHHVRLEPASEFLNWSTVRGTMFVGNTDYVAEELEDLKDVWERWKWALGDSGFGKPPLYNEQLQLTKSVDSRFQTTGSYIHQCYCLKQWEQKSEAPIEAMRSLVEFGGGYGALRVIAGSLGFQGKYTLYDLPEFSLLQEYYISNVLPDSKTHYSSRINILPTEIDLIVAVASLSEIPVEVRNDFFDRVSARYYYIIFQHQFNGIDNMEYFKDFAESKPEHDWQIWKDDLLPHYFLSGVPK